MYDNNEFYESFVELYRVIIQFESNDTQLNGRYFQMLSHFIGLYKRNEEALGACLERLLTQLIVAIPLNPKANDSFDIKCNAVSTRRQICWSLLHIAKRIATHCLAFQQPLQQKLTEIMEQRDEWKNKTKENMKKHGTNQLV